MKDRMIIIRDGVMFIITVTHEQAQDQGVKAQETKTADEKPKEQQLPDITISAN